MSSSSSSTDPWGDVSADSGLAALEDVGDVSSHQASDDYNPTYGNVYRAVADGKPAADLRLEIELAARGCDKRRKAAVNERHRVCVPSNFAHERWRARVETPIAAAHRLRRRDLIAVLLEAGADPRSTFDGKITQLAAAAVIGEVSTVRYLLKAGHDPNEKMPQGSMVAGGTALHAAMCGHLIGYKCAAEQQIECFRVLVVEGGADVEAKDAEGETPFLCLWRGWALKMSRDFLDVAFGVLVGELGADPNATDAHGRTALFCYAKSSDLAAVEMLLKHGASADVVDEEGMSVLMWALWRGRYNTSYPTDAATRLVLRASSPETLRALRGASTAVSVALSAMTSWHRWPDLMGWHIALLGELLAAGVPYEDGHVLDLHYGRHLLCAATVAVEARDAELAASRSDTQRVPARAESMRLLLLYRERPKSVLKAQLARLAALEEELRALDGGGGGGGGSKDQGGEKENEKEDEDEAGGK